ncbi:hypothetical protein B0T26DRAFT_642310 [Lasiosphaeria miniovina]|uniref:non-specific serine/threonine protein kinase n=1 Tax=Lasiosphaeria miniovina TaxID=1954250 RepID=A0AA40AV04_9PEZI|nr:uncharacterized protein B0T26DRAFT_642310 [Lasiosphaeria miniovina]KAK0722468.1 hypothetical protein B0T26DRAFT_642310 [Lasiosphaeria miniovina]
MPTTTMVRKYGKPVKKTRAERLFAELPKSPTKKMDLPREPQPQPALENMPDKSPVERDRDPPDEVASPPQQPVRQVHDEAYLASYELQPPETNSQHIDEEDGVEEKEEEEEENDESQALQILTWADVCPFGDRIEKIAEASYAEVYRITNERGTSIIKAVRLESPIKPQTKTQERSGLVDEEPHSEDDLRGELRISEWLADVPGFVVYKERFVVRGKAPKALLETHQVFHRKLKRKDPDRLQFYPSPSRYLDDTRFLVVELGDAGVALEDFELESASQLWDIFLHTAIALARAEDLIKLEHRDLHEGNLCIRQARPRKAKTDDGGQCQFGCSGLEITILDYGLSRAQDPDCGPGQAAESSSVAYDLEKDLGIFTSTHAPQCKVYRQMRSFLLKGDRVHLAPNQHHTAYAAGVDGRPLSWEGHHPYTNVLWLAYIYQYLARHFKGDKRELARFRRETKQLLDHLDPEAPRHILSFPSAADVVRFAAEAGWITQDQLMGTDRDRSRLEAADESLDDLGSVAAFSESIIEVRAAEAGAADHLRRSPRKSQITQMADVAK